MKVPDTIYNKIKAKLWGLADSLNWPTLADPHKTALYEEWIRAEDVGGVLSRYIPPANIRVYIKDTIMKPYGRERIKDFSRILPLVGLPTDSRVSESYIKPHGRRLEDGKVICWGLSRDWKSILFAVYERGFLGKPGIPFAAVILAPAGKLEQPTYRQLVESAAEKLGIQRLIWFNC